MTALPFKRMVIRFHQGAGPSGERIRLAAQLASAWQVELVGAIDPDPNLGRIAQLPASREYRLHERRWNALETATVTSDLSAMSRMFERSFSEMVRSVNAKGRFVFDGGIEDSDLLLVGEPESPLEQLCQSFRDAILRALQSSRPVMVLPRRIDRGRGPVLVITREPGDPLHSLGSDLAVALGETVRTLEEPAGETAASLIERIEAMAPRLVVLPRKGLAEPGETLCIVARACRIPLLVAGENRQSESPGSD